MSSYSKCVTSLGLNGKIPGRELKDAAAEYQKDGMPADKAMLRAVEDKLELMQMEERKIVAAVRAAYEEQGGKKRAPNPKKPVLTVVPKAAAEKSAPAPTDTPAQEVATPATPISDFGEKIHGAKKDLWTGFKATMKEALPADVKEITLAKHFPEPPYEKLIEEGADPRALAAFKAIRDVIPAKPRVPYKAKRWGELVVILRDFANRMISGDEKVGDVIKAMRASTVPSDVADRIELYADLGYPLFTKAKDYEIEKNHYSMFKGETPPGGVTKYELKNNGRSVGYFDSRDEAMAALREKFGAAPEAGGPRTVKLDLYRVTSTGDIVIGKKVSSGKYIDLKTGFKDVRSARTYLAENQAELEKLLEQKKDVRPERRSVNDPRVGVDRRKGEDVTPEQFGTTFGFRGVQFGNYVEQKRRAADLNNAYDALLDLADLLDVPPAALSLNGTLGLAFGARGSGGKNAAAAHFEPDNIVINLTKTNGAGSLAHEWFHGLDNYFERMRGATGAGHVTDRPEVRKIQTADRKLVDDDRVRPEVLDAVKGVMDAINASGMPKRSRELDARRSKDYWSTTHELAARAFESYIIDKAAEHGLSNDYLANILSEDAHKVMDEMTGSTEPFPYPTRAEAPAINAAFDKLFDTIETRDEGGKPVLYSVTDDSAATAIADLMAAKEGETTINRPDVGDITIVYGDGKSGLSHIAKRRGEEFMERLPELLRDGKVYTKEGQTDRIFIGNTRDEAVIRLDRDGADGKWLLSAYEKYPDLKASTNIDESAAAPRVKMKKAGLRTAVTGDGVLGQVVASMIDAGVVVLHDGPGTLPRNSGNNVKGVQALTMPDGTIHMVASNLTPKNARAVMLHEAFHQGAEKLIGGEQWSKLMGRAGSLYRQSELSSGKAREFFDKARARVASAKAKGAVATRMEVEEFMAYAIEEYESAPASIKKWVDDLIGLVKAWMVARFGKQLGAVTPAQLSAIARVAIMDAAYQKRGQIFGPAGEWFSVDDQPAAGMPSSKELTEILRKHPFTKLRIKPNRMFVAGSFATGKQRQDSDIDVIVEVPEGVDAGDLQNEYRRRASDYFMKHDLQGVHDDVHPQWDGRRIDVYFVEDAEKASEGRPLVPLDDARYSVAGDAEPEGLTPPEQGRFRNLQSQIQDNMNRVKQVQERINEIAGNIKEKADYYLAETLRPGRIAARLEEAREHLYKPLLERLGKSGHTMEQLEELLHAMHAEERNERVASINDQMPDGGSGMTTAEANEILKKYEAAGELHELAKQARDIAKATLDLKLAYGLITKEDHDSLAKMYKNYVPLKGDGEYGPKIKRAMGHEERDEQILDNIGRDYDQSIVVGEKNLARQSLLRMVLQYADPDLWTVGAPPKGRYVAGRVYNIVHHGETVGSFTSRSQVDAFLEAKGAQSSQYQVLDSNGDRVAEFTKPLQDNEVIVYVKGEPVRIQINDEKLASQLRPLKGDQMGPILESMRTLNQYLSKIYTGYNPSFILRNTARDLMTGTINMTGNEGITTTAKALIAYPSAMKAMFKWAKNKETPPGRMGEYLNEYRMHGGKVGASWMSDLETHGKSLEAYYDDARGLAQTAKAGEKWRASKVAWRKTVGQLAHIIEILNQTTENAMRLSLYATMREQGETPAKAAQAAKTVTVDFDRKGTSTSALGAVYLFLNPAIQGTANMAKTMSKGKHKEQAWALVGGVAALGYMMAAAGMDDDKDRWLGEGWETRTKNMIMNVGGRQVKIPLSQEYAPAYAFGAAMAEASRGESKMRSAARIMSSFIDAYFPLQGAFKEESDNHGADIGMSLIPTALKPYMESWFNRNSFGSQIVPEQPTTKDKPDNLKMSRGTKNTAFDKVAQGIAAAGVEMGAGKYENDITKVSPETLKHFWRTYTGGLGQFIADSTGLASMAADDPSQIDRSDVPIVKDFVKSEGDVKQIRGRFHDLTRGARTAIAEFQMAKKAGDNEEMDRLNDDTEKGPLSVTGKMLSKYAKATAEIRDEAVEVNADPSLKPAEKRAKLKELEAEEEALYRQAIEAFK